MRGVSSEKKTFRLSGKVTPYDTRRIMLFVGFSEYGNAMMNFLKVLKSSDDEEIEAMDRIVAEKPEFIVYTNLSKKLQSGPSSLAPSNDYPDDDGARRGLGWIMALARVELGAMLTGYSDANTPFAFFPLIPFDLDEYRDLLMDGAKTHYWSLVKDPNLKEVTETSPENPIVLAYSRRLLIARTMLNSAIRLGQQSYSDFQMRELSSWQDSMNRIQVGLVLKIKAYLQTTQVTRTKSTPYTDACGAMLRAEARELSAGTAVIERLR